MWSHTVNFHSGLSLLMAGILFFFVVTLTCLIQKAVKTLKHSGFKAILTQDILKIRLQCHGKALTTQYTQAPTIEYDASTALIRETLSTHESKPTSRTFNNKLSYLIHSILPQCFPTLDQSLSFLYNQDSVQSYRLHVPNKLHEFNTCFFTYTYIA